MILPIYAYGQPVLKSVCDEIEKDHEGLEELIANMWQTMYEASGVGLAAPQVGKSIRLFIVDTKQVVEDNPDEEGIKEVFINARRIKEDGEPWAYEEGCLSIPFIRADVIRPEKMIIEYYDENWKKHKISLDGINARVVQHEYDHIEGILFTEHLKPLKKKMLKRKLEAIRKGNIDADYRMKFKSMK